jgi:predicted ABC-type ATPase
MDLEKSVLHPAEHCQQCITESDAGFRPIGEMVPIGSRTCGRNCRCTVVYQRSNAGEVFGDAGRAALVGASGPDIMARLASAYPPARPGERETLNAFTTADGRLTPERQQLHDAIVRQHFQGAEPVADPTVYVMGGGPASGKSVMLDKLDTPANTVTIDSDHIKTLLPEFREGAALGDANAATMVHEESSVLAKRIVAEAAGGRYRIVVDGTGDNSYANLAKKVASYRAGGGRIVANYVTVDTETAVARAQARGERSGRFVPETFIREVHRNISSLVPRALEEGLFDEFTLWDNNGAAGSAKVIARYRDGQLTVLDEDLWQRFLAKAT